VPSKPPGPAVEPTKHHIQWSPEAVTAEERSGRGLKLTTLLPLLARIKLMELYLHSYFIHKFTFVCYFVMLANVINIYCWALILSNTWDLLLVCQLQK